MWRFLLLGICFLATSAYADSVEGDPVGTVNEFSEQIVLLLKGPITKILGAIVLLGGVAGLLRGRHHIAIACGAAFIVLLFLPMLLGHVGGTGN